MKSILLDSHKIKDSYYFKKFNQPLVSRDAKWGTCYKLQLRFQSTAIKSIKISF